MPGTYDMKNSSPISSGKVDGHTKKGETPPSSLVFPRPLSFSPVLSRFPPVFPKNAFRLLHAKKNMFGVAAPTQETMTRR